MSKLSTLDNPLERISCTDAPKENPYKEKCGRCDERDRKGWYGKCAGCKLEDYQKTHA